MKRLFLYSTSVLLFLLMIHVSAVAAQAAVLNFSPASASVGVGGTVSPQIQEDSGSVQVAGTDVYVIYDPAYLEAQSVTQGTHFPIVSNNITQGKVYIAGVVDDTAPYKTGLGTVATVNFKALKTGSTTLTFFCDNASTETSKIVQNDINATNVIECNNLGTYTVTITGTGTGTGTGTTTTVTTLSQGSSGNVQQLPQSGVYENVLHFAIPGVSLLAIGIVMRLLFRI